MGQGLTTMTTNKRLCHPFIFFAVYRTCCAPAPRVRSRVRPPLDCLFALAIRRTGAKSHEFGAQSDPKHEIPAPRRVLASHLSRAPNGLSPATWWRVGFKRGQFARKWWLAIVQSSPQGVPLVGSKAGPCAGEPAGAEGRLLTHYGHFFVLLISDQMQPHARRVRPSPADGQGK